MSTLHTTQVSLFNIESMASLAISTTSRICLPFMREHDLETTFLVTFFRLFANTLARTLYGPPTKLIGFLVLNAIHSRFTCDQFLLSIMSLYIPSHSLK